MLIFSLCNRDAFVLLWFDMVSDKGLLQGSWMLHDMILFHLFHSYTAKLSPGLTYTIVTADHKQLIGAFPAGCERQTRKWTRQCNVSELVPYPLSNPNYNFVYCVCFKLTCSFTSLHLHFLATFPNVGEETAFGSHSRVWTHCCAVSKYWAVWTDTPQEAVPALRLFVSWALSTLNVWQQSMQITSFFFLLPDGLSKHARLFENMDGDIIGNHWFCLMATSKHSKCTPHWIPQTSQWCLPTYSVGALPAPL